MKIKVNVTKTIKLTLDDLSKLLKMGSIGDVKVEYGTDMRGEPTNIQRIVITTTVIEEHEV